MEHQIFQEKGFLIIIVSNQSLVARGFITKKKMWKLDRYVRNLLNKVGVKITKSYYCPHYPNIDGDCLCRKPKPGLILQAISEWNLDPDKSFIIGDSLRDIQAGRSAGVRYGILVMKNQKKWNLPDEALKTVEFKKNNIKEALLVAKHLLE